MREISFDEGNKEANPATGGEIRWNFTKFVIGRDGRQAARFGPDSAGVIRAVEEALG